MHYKGLKGFNALCCDFCHENVWKEKLGMAELAALHPQCILKAVVPQCHSVLSYSVQTVV